MIFPSYRDFAKAPRTLFGTGPFALVIAEDRVEVVSTVTHLMQLGFQRIFLAAPEEYDLSADIEGFPIDVIRHPTRQRGTTETLVNALIDKLPGAWLHYCYNAEYLFFPYCEHRNITEATSFVAEERRSSILTFVVDLYAEDLTIHPDAVSLEDAHLDSAGYYAEARRDAEGLAMDRQMNFYGGLRWRFEEHVPEAKRNISRVALFQARPGLRLRENHSLSDEEMNTYACPWHHSMTAALCSFRVAKALCSNPGSRAEIKDFRWHATARFGWSSPQLMSLGLMEPGQWF